MHPGVAPTDLIKPGGNNKYGQRSITYGMIEVHLM